MVFREQPSPTHQRFLFVTVSLSPVSSRDEIRQYDAVHAKLCNGNEEEAGLPRLSTARNCSFDSCSSAILTKKKKKGRDLSSSQVFSSNRESIDVSRFVAIAKHDAIFFFVEERREGVIAVIHRFFTVNNFTGGGASVSMSGNKKKRRKKTCKDSRGSNVTRKPRIAGGGGSPSWPKITFLPTPRNYHCVVPQ